MNLPNKITVFRICMIPVFLILYPGMPFGEPVSRWAALIVFAIASASDALDGYIARSRGLVTDFGKLFDPLADKLLVAAALVAMVERQVLPAWVVILIISREFFITGFRQMALRKDIVMAASYWGKAKMVVQTAMIVYLLADFPSLWPGGSTIFGFIGMVLIYLSALLTVVSAAEYVYKNKKVLE